MRDMTLEAQHNPSRPVPRGGFLANYVQVASLLAAFTALLAAVLWPQLGRNALILASLLSIAIVVFAARVSPSTAMRIYGARPYETGDLAQFDRIAAELARRAGLRAPPRLYLVPSMLVTTFSIGSSHRFATALTEGLLRRLTMREVAAVLAREAAHAQRGDLFAFGAADTVSRCAQGLYYVGLALAALNVLSAVTGGERIPWLSIILMVLAPTLMNLLQLGLSHAREQDADRTAALLTGDPLGVASAISRIDAFAGSPIDDILPPVPARKVALPSMLRLSTDVERRVSRVTAFDAPPMPPLDITEGPRISLIGVGPIELRPRYRWPGVWF
ncbi:MAG: zinc metalloprotease HtpX [Hyphomicrobium sp.]|jgi:heat shock protein HtpX